MKDLENFKSKHEKIFLKDYTPCNFRIEKVNLNFFLNISFTRVVSEFNVNLSETYLRKSADLILDGSNLQLLNISVNDRKLRNDEFVLTSKYLKLPSFSGGKLIIETAIKPIENTDLDGLYASSGGLYTQCEAEGFRKITYFLDRPDILTKYTVQIHAKKKEFPVLLSNGNLINEKYDDNTGTISRTWEDPFPKPTYLFALVAADLSLHEEVFKLRDGNNILLQFYTEKQDINKVFHALASLKSAILWDENRNQLSLDLERFMVVAVPDFNSGAMENKGLNLFNTKYVLADQNLTTDTDYEAITAVIGHEYFHNWTGNRVTCRDWFQLTLKEGLTVFREQEFVADHNSMGLTNKQATSAKAVKRIEDVQILRDKQFPEDSSPMSHPIRPSSYSEIRNFYTTTIYEKGAEVIRMLHTIFGEQGFQNGMKLYFKNFDGSAATCEDFVNCILKANSSQHLFHIFMRWYDSNGTPTVKVEEEWDASNKSFTITFEQLNPKGCVETKPLLIPVKYKFLNSIELGHTDSEKLILLMESKKKINFYFPHLTKNAKPIISLFRNFSSPIKIIRSKTVEDMFFEQKKESDPFNKWDTIQQIFMLTLTERNEEKNKKNTKYLLKSLDEILLSDELSEAFKAVVFTPPSDNSICESLTKNNILIDPEVIFQKKSSLLKNIAMSLDKNLLETYYKVKESIPNSEYEIDPISIGKRKFKNLLQLWISQSNTSNKWKQMLTESFFESNNMTDKIFSLKSLLLQGEHQSKTALSNFFEKFKDDSIALDKWIAIQIESKEFFSKSNETVTSKVKNFLQKSFFSRSNPNRVYALLGTYFFKNMREFHRGDDLESYEIWVNEILLLDNLNSQLAARLTRSFDGWKNFESRYQSKMKVALETVAKKSKSKDVLEVCTRLLENK